MAHVNKYKQHSKTREAFRQVRGCIRKRQFPSKQSAEEFIADAEGNLELRCYACHFCDQWHLTKNVAGARR